MGISVGDVKNIAKLACLGMTESECLSMADELTYVMNWISQLQSVDVSDIVLHNDAASMPEREDLATELDHSTEIMQLAPESVDKWFAVPKTIKL
jgi:aspartyl-tRNA(Asn)/glutamyl-tRNA(Gln) amidotransferase subunit C